MLILATGSWDGDFSGACSYDSHIFKVLDLVRARVETIPIVGSVEALALALSLHFQFHFLFCKIRIKICRIP
jgi:hypothetical protein